jgi:hypothetical protein
MIMQVFLDPKATHERYQRARHRRSAWENLWEECYEFALPHRGGIMTPRRPGERRTDRLFDGTAPDAVDQLAASLMSQLTPPWARWFRIAPGPDADAADRRDLATELERSTRILLSHFDRSNFAVEIHQCYLDLVTAGTASLMFEEASAGVFSAFRFAAVPLSQVAVEEGASGRLDTTFRRSELTAAQLLERFPEARAAEPLMREIADNADTRIAVLEAVIPNRLGHSYLAFVDAGFVQAADPIVLAKGSFSSAPFINFRWLKAPGEIYGRSPVMKALPDIKTANKVVELVLKNASIAVTGIWQADDDGVINPATIKLVPGAIIPKAVGSAGLRPLETPGRFDVSELVLDQLRGRIRKALFVDQLGQINGPRMSATEVLERAAEMSRILGATFGRLQTELLTPLLHRAQSILARRGEIADLPIDGRIVVLEYNAALARYQAQQDAQSTILWLNVVRELGPQGMAVVDQGAAARWLGQALGVPGEIMRGIEETPIEALAVGDLLKSPVIEDLVATAAEAMVPASEEADFDKLS